MSKFFKITEILIFLMTLIGGIRVYVILSGTKIVVPGLYALILSSIIGLIISVVFFKKEKEEYKSFYLIIKRTCLIVSFFLGYMFMATASGA